MSQQQSLFGLPAWQTGQQAAASVEQRATPELPHNHTPTSVAAARSMRYLAGSQLDRILKFVRDRGQHGATNEEIAEGTGIKLQSVCARARALELAGKVIDSKRQRNTTSGHPAKIWVAAGQGSAVRSQQAEGNQ